MLKFLLCFGVDDALPISHEFLSLSFSAHVCISIKFWMNKPRLLDICEDVLVDMPKAEELWYIRINVRESTPERIFVICEEDLNMGVTKDKLSKGRDCLVIGLFVLIGNESLANARSLACSCNSHKMNCWHVVFICPIRRIDKDYIRRCLCKLDHIVWGEEDEVDMPIISCCIAEGPAIIINKLSNEAFD